MTEIQLPPLREELTLYKGPRDKEGGPTWTIHDPSSNRFFLIHWLDFEIVKRWGLVCPEDIVTEVNAQTSLNIDISCIHEMLHFLVTNSLVTVRGGETIKRFAAISKKSRKRDIFWLLQNYLFLRIPLVKPDGFLRATYPLVRWLYSPACKISLLIVLFMGLYFSARQWDFFIVTMRQLFNFQDMLWYIVALGFCKIIHELGHAYTAHRYGCRVPSMGLMFLVLMPVLFTDTTESWKLADHIKRLKIAASGMVAEIALASISLFLWGVLPDSPVRTAAFMIATSAWIITLAINLSPFMKYDGYYMISDWFQIPNLQNRSFDYGKWWLREKLFGFEDDPPEVCSKKQQYGMVLYSFSVWVYRFFLYTGIALLVYAKFTKILGIVLLMVEVVYFVSYPIIHEIFIWWKLRENIHLNRNTVRTLFLLIGAILLLFMPMPWAGTIFLPATQKPLKSTTVFTNLSGKVERVFVKKGQHVEAGDSLLTLSSADLDYQIAQIRSQIQIITWQLDLYGVADKLRSNQMVLISELEEAKSRRRGMEEERQQLIITAPFGGWVKEISDTIQTGQTVAVKEPLFFMVADSGSIIEAFAPENVIKRILPGLEVTYFPEIPELPDVTGEIIKIDQTTTLNLPDPYLASPMGGEIAATLGRNGQIAPQNAIYRLRIGPADRRETAKWISRGRVKVNVEPESYAKKIARQVKSLIIRESGF